MPQRTATNFDGPQKQESVCRMQMWFGMGGYFRSCFPTDRLLQQVQGRMEKAELRHNQTASSTKKRLIQTQEQVFISFFALFMLSSGLLGQVARKSIRRQPCLAV